MSIHGPECHEVAPRNHCLRDMRSALRQLKLILLALVSALLLGCGGEDNNDSRVTELSLTGSAESLDAGTTNYVVLTAQVKDENATLLPAVTIEFSATLGRLEASTAVTNTRGEVKLKFFADNFADTATITAFVNGYQEKLSIEITSAAQSGSNVGGLELTVLNEVLPADGSSTTAIDVLVTDIEDNLLSERQVQITTNAGSLYTSLGGDASTTVNVSTDTKGGARVFLQSSATATTALLGASSEGVNAAATVKFTPGIPDLTNSSITASPSSVPANGSDTTEVTVVLLDANSNLVADGTEVTLQSTAGVITTSNPQKTNLGRALFTLQSPTTVSIADLSILEYSGISTQAIFGSSSSPDPANIEVVVADPTLFVAGVGKQDSTSLTVTVKTAAGNLVADADAGVNNLLARFKTKPNGGEKLIGTDANADIVESDTSIAVRSVEGVATLTLQAGTLPGVIELEAEALNPDGSVPATRLTTTISQVTIASGPPHNIVLSYPIKESIEDLGAGIYRRIGSASVTDRYGNSVPDDTAISLGLLDSVIASNRAPSLNGSVTDNNATVSANANELVDVTNTNLSSATITRNDTSRGLQSNDRVLIFNAQAGDKSRFINKASGSIQSDRVVVNKDYINSSIGLEYLIGAALLGGQISGVNAETNTIQTGQATTKDGLATFYVTYPADVDRILTGCFQYEPTLDLRHQPSGSAQVWLVAESNETGATTLDNRFCYSAIADYQLLNSSGFSSISATEDILFQLRDANDVPLPYQRLRYAVVYESNTGGLIVSVGDCELRSDRRTNEAGYCKLRLTVTGGASGDSATITVSASGNAESASVSVSIP